MAFNRSKRPRLGLWVGLRLPIGPFGTCATLGLNLYMLPHEVVRRLHLCPFRPISALRGVLRVRIGCYNIQAFNMLPAPACDYYALWLIQPMCNMSSLTMTSSHDKIHQTFPPISHAIQIVHEESENEAINAH